MAKLVHAGCHPGEPILEVNLARYIKRNKSIAFDSSPVPWMLYTGN